MNSSRHLMLILFICLYSTLANAWEGQHAKYMESIQRMVNSGVLSEQEGKEQIGQLKISEQHTEQTLMEKQSRGIASTLSEQKVIEFSNEPIEIQVK